MCVYVLSVKSLCSQNQFCFWKVSFEVIACVKVFLICAKKELNRRKVWIAPVKNFTRCHYLVSIRSLKVYLGYKTTSTHPFAMSCGNGDLCLLVFLLILCSWTIRKIGILLHCRHHFTLLGMKSVFFWNKYTASVLFIKHSEINKKLLCLFFSRFSVTVISSYHKEVW